MSETAIIDVEPIEDTTAATPAPAPLATTTPQAPQGGALALFGTTDPVAVVKKATEVAGALMGPVIANSLYIEKEGGKKYLNVEAWTLLASMLQVRAIPLHTEKTPDHEGRWAPPKMRVETRTQHGKWCKNGQRNQAGEATHQQTDGCQTYTKDYPVLEEPGHGGYTARVEAYDAAGNVIGAADSQCMWEEWRWRDSDAFALQSMAQTRGISKALSGPLRFIVELAAAGFKGTPAEEVDGRDGSGWGDSRPAASDEPDDGRTCPACGSGVFDNTDDPEKMEKQWPAFKCKNRACTGLDGKPWATWERDFFAADPETQKTNKAKALLLTNVTRHQEQSGAWDRLYDLDDPAIADDEDLAALVSEAQDNNDDRLRAGILWRDIITAAGIDTPADDEDRARILRTADQAMTAAAQGEPVDFAAAWEATAPKADA